MFTQVTSGIYVQFGPDNFYSKVISYSASTPEDLHHIPGHYNGKMYLLFTLNACFPDDKAKVPVGIRTCDSYLLHYTNMFKGCGQDSNTVLSRVAQKPFRVATVSFSDTNNTSHTYAANQLLTSCVCVCV